MQSNRVLFNPARLYAVLNAATSAVATDPQLASLRSLYELVFSMRDIPVARVQFLTVPRKPYHSNASRDELIAVDAARLFRRLRADQPVEVVHTEPDRGRPSATPTGAPTPAPAFTGTTAAAATCG